MPQFKDLLSEYLRLYGDTVREFGYDIEFRGIQHNLYLLAKIVESEDSKVLSGMIEELKEDNGLRRV